MLNFFADDQNYCLQNALHLKSCRHNNKKI